MKIKHILSLLIILSTIGIVNAADSGVFKPGFTLWNWDINLNNQSIHNGTINGTRFITSNTSLVTNFNADMLDGAHASQFNSNLTNHTDNISNPHNVTIPQLGTNFPNTSLVNYLLLAGGTMAGNINMNNKQITNILEFGSNIGAIGTLTISTLLEMNHKTIRDLGEPVYSDDAATKSYVDNKTASFTYTNFSSYIIGGVITEINGYRIHTFYNNSSLNVSLISPINIDYLVIGGGGSSGVTNAGNAGGGGAGGFLNGSMNISTGNYSVTVGSGGQYPNNNGGNSIFASITSYGGGKGGYYENLGVGNGGSGGGAPQTTASGGTGITGQGYNGGSTSSSIGGSGGGGASQTGQNSYGANKREGGYGGYGNFSNINFTNVCLAGGGAGSSHGTATNGTPLGYCGGGNGHYGAITGKDGTANTGGGGGGGGENIVGGSGGSGIIIIRYLISDFDSLNISTLVTNLNLSGTIKASIPQQSTSNSAICGDLLGNFFINTGLSTCLVSSEKFKTNIYYINNNFTNKIMELKPISYIETITGKNRIGLKAEDVNNIFPELVGKDEYGRITGIEYQLFSVYLLSSYQELIKSYNEQINKTLILETKLNQSQNDIIEIQKILNITPTPTPTKPKPTPTPTNKTI